MSISSRHVVIRPARSRDAPAIEHLYKQLVDSPLIHVSTERLEALHTDPSHQLLVAEVEGDVLGTALLCFCKDVMYGFQPFAVVENLVVDKYQRGGGIGSRLLQTIERLCLEKDCSKIMLLSSAHRTEAHRFFEREGFRGDNKRGFVKYRRDLVVVR